MGQDSFYQIGKTHEVCEDFALSGKQNGIQYAIVCDGCSASDNVDFGARVLAYAAKEELIRLQEFDLTYHNFGKRVILKAQEVTRSLNLPDTTLDATLLIAIIDTEGNLLVRMFGDGVCVVGHGDKGNAIAHIEYESGAPYYLSYQLDINRDNQYRNIFCDKQKIYYTDRIGTSKHYFDYPVEFKYKKGEFTQVSLISDGINQFCFQDQNLPFEEMISKLTEYKNKTGVFVKRRLKMLARENEKNQIFCNDDISVASVIV